MRFKQTLSYRWCWGEDVPSVTVSLMAFLPPLSVRQHSYLHVLTFLKPITSHHRGFSSRPNAEKTLLPRIPRTRQIAARSNHSVANESGQNSADLPPVSIMALKVQTTKQTLNAMQSPPIAIAYCSVVLLFRKLITRSLGVRIYVQFIESPEHRKILLLNRCPQNFPKSEYSTRLP